jgi:exopolysaccharide biosynthesis predicted pyruvyltransferase EpsI
MKILLNKIKNNKIFYCVICLVSIIILLWSLFRNNLVEKFETKQMEENNLNELDMIKFLKNYQNKKIIYIPNYGNGGDSLIASGTYQLFDKLKLDYQIGNLNKIYNNEILFFAGGGALIDIYSNSNQYNFLMNNLDNNEVIILPHTFKNVDKLLKKFNKNTTIICREKKSYNYVKQNVKESVRENVYISDDMAFYLNLDRYKNKKESSGILNYFRKDVEKTNINIPKDNIDLSSKFVYDPNMTNKELVIKNTYDILDYINKYEVVNTNRLHGAIGASLLNKRVNFYKNSYWKNKEMYEYSLKNKYPNTIFYN